MANLTVTIGAELSLTAAQEAIIYTDDIAVAGSVLSLTGAVNAVGMTGDVTIDEIQNASMSLDITALGDITTDGVKNIVTNARNFAITEYSNFPFNSMAKFNGKYVYAKADGIYEGGGSDDNGTNIEASYKTGAIDMYATEVQRLRDAYLTFRASGDIQLFSVGDEDNSRAYNITNNEPVVIQERRVKFERGIRDRYFNFGVSNVNGSTFGMRTVKVLSEPIRKRR